MRLVDVRKYVPNAITISRPLLGFLIVYLHGIGWYKTALGVAIFTALSDAIDGHLARLWKAESKFGERWDPLTDKMFCWTFTGVLLTLYPLDPGFLAVVLFFAVYDGGITAIRYLFGRRNIPTNSYAKFKTTLLMTSLVVLYAAQMIVPMYLQTISYTVGILIGCGAIGYGVCSAVTYIRGYGWGDYLPRPLHLL